MLGFFLNTTLECLLRRKIMYIKGCNGTWGAFFQMASWTVGEICR